MMRHLRSAFILVNICFVLLSCGGGGEGGGGGNGNSIEKQSEEIISTQNNGRQYYFDLISNGETDALQKTVEWLKTKENVEDSVIGDDSISIWIKYKSGIVGVILTRSNELVNYSADFLGYRSKKDLITKKYIITNNLSAVNKKALILNATEVNPKYVNKDPSIEVLKSYLQEAGFSFDIFRGTEVTIEKMKTLSNYGFAYINTHGGLGFKGWNLIGSTVVIMTGEIADVSLVSLYWNSLVAMVTSGLTIVSPPFDQNSYFGLTKKFFDDYKYPSTFIYMNACFSLANDSLADSFLNNGASLYLGFDNISFTQLTSEFNIGFFQELFKVNNTFEQSYNSSVLSMYFPMTVYKDDNKNGQFHVTYANGNDASGSDMGDLTYNYSLMLKYKGNNQFILNGGDTSPPTISTSSPLPTGTVGTAYSQTFTATGGTLPYTWSLASGTLPEGFTLSTSGVLSGTPTTSNTFTFTIRMTGANNASSTKDFTLTVTSSTVTVPAAPSNLQAAAAFSYAIKLTWTDASNNEEGFKVYRWTTSSTVTTLVATLGVGTTSYSDTGLTSSTTYYYKVTAYNSVAESDPSNVANATTYPIGITPPTTPTGLSSNAVSPNQINLSWNASIDDVGVAGYYIYRYINNVYINGVYEPTTSYSDTGLAPDTQHCYYVVAYDTDGLYSAYSDPVCTTTTSVSTIVKISAGGLHSLALSSDGTIKAWGFNSHGQLGVDVGNLYSSIPVQVTGINNATEIAACGLHYSLAILSDGTVKGWGAQLGVMGGGYMPVTVPGISNAVKIACDSDHYLALISDGTIKAWGNNFYGELGNGTNTDSYGIPVSVTGINNAVAISAGPGYSLAMLADGSIKEWGLISAPDLTSNIPVNVNGINNAIAIESGQMDQLALLADGTVMRWKNWAIIPVPTIIPGISNAKAISAGVGHDLIVLSDGTIKTVGVNMYGQLGNGTNTASDIPVSVIGISNGSTVSAGSGHSLALLSDGKVKAWGWNGSGQLGNGTTIDSNVPVDVSGF